MEKRNLDKLRGRFEIYCNGNYAVLSGSVLYILRTDGTVTACRRDLRYAGRITFLSADRMLLCCKAVFHMIDLASGCDIWEAPYTKFELNTADLAISPDESYAYTYDQWKNRHFISRLDLHTLEVDSFDMDMDVGATRDICCDEAGVPCLLKTLAETVGGKQVHQNGIRIHDFSDSSPGNTTCWKSKWTFPGGKYGLRFLGSINRVVTSDLCLYETVSGASEDFLERETSWEKPEVSPSDCWMDHSGRYLCLKYLTANVVIDLQERRVAAQYAANYQKGCLVGGEYWICEEGRIRRKPFPAMEAFPEW